MQSKFLSLAAILLCSVVFLFCRKDTPDPVEESPFFDFFNESSIVVDTIGMSVSSGTTWEYGFVFTPLKDGKISKLGLKLPATGEFQVTLWDLSGTEPVILNTRKINSTAVHANTFADISAISVKAGVKLGITVLSDVFYRMTKANNNKFVFPRTIGNLRIESFNETQNSTTMPMFPATTNDTRVAPCVNVIFIAD